jgi:hypothetical protein
MTPTLLGSPAATGSSQHTSEAQQQYDYYSNIIRQNGFSFDEQHSSDGLSSRPNRNLLFFRTPTDLDANGGRGAYDDTAVLLWKDAGGKHVRTYHANIDVLLHLANSMRSNPPATAQPQFERSSNGKFCIHLDFSARCQVAR